MRSVTSWHRILDRSTFEIACRRVDDVPVLRAKRNGSCAKIFSAALCQFCAVEFLTGLGNRRIILTSQAGELRIDVRGDLAEILAISLKTKTPATGTGVSQVEMVAGIGFEPMTFRL